MTNVMGNENSTIQSNSSTLRGELEGDFRGGLSLHLQILSPEKRLFDGQVSKVSFPGTKGRFTVLPRHAALISSLDKGVINFSEVRGDNPHEGVEHIQPIFRGFVEVNNNEVVACVEISEE